MNNNRHVLLLLVVLSAMIQACNKDKNNNTPKIYPDYAMLTPGNFWIYERYDVDSNGNGSSIGVFDSCFVEKDTLINGNTYAKVMRPSVYSPYPIPVYLRDSLHYIVSDIGTIVFSSQDFNNVLEHDYYITSSAPGSDTVSEVTRKMVNKDVSFTVPAGTFITSEYQTHYYMYPGYDYPYTNRYLHTRYAQNIGIISETMLFYSSNPNYTELRLLRYYVQ